MITSWIRGDADLGRHLLRQADPHTQKAEAIHELDFLDGSTAMSTKVFFNVLFGD